MKKRPSKPAPATRRTASRSGMSARTGATANGRRRKVKPEGKFAFIVEDLRAMSQEEFWQSLIDAGIIDASTGQLASKYRRGVKGSALKAGQGATDDVPSLEIQECSLRLLGYGRCA